jgi:hypothetical protein
MSSFPFWLKFVPLTEFVFKEASMHQQALDIGFRQAFVDLFQCGVH